VNISQPKLRSEKFDDDDDDYDDNNNNNNLVVFSGYLIKCRFNNTAAHYKARTKIKTQPQNTNTRNPNTKHTKKNMSR